MKASEFPSYMRPLYNFPQDKPSKLLNTIKVETPWKQVSKSFNLKTSYATSFSPSPKKNFSLLSTGQQILNNSAYLTTGSSTDRLAKQPSKSKSLARVTETVTDKSAIYGKRISPPQINSPIKFDPDHFDKVVEKSITSKISDKNSDWISQQEKRNYAKRYNGGEYIPSVSELQVYGRKEPMSKFDKAGLWKPANLLSD